jgi:ribosomal protein S18 acetylase RimI-like enzyme
MRELEITKAQENDAGSVAALLLELEDGVGRKVDNNLQILEDSVLKVIACPDNLVLLAKLDGETVGLISLHFRDTMLHDQSSGLIDELVVSAGKREQGIGRMLVEAAVGAARKRGCCEVEVSTEKSNAAALDFYKAMGFDDFGVFLEKDV